MASNTNVADSCHDNISLNGDSNNKCVSKDLELGRLSCLNLSAGIVQRAGQQDCENADGGVGDEEGGVAHADNQVVIPEACCYSCKDMRRLW